MSVLLAARNRPSGLTRRAHELAELGDQAVADRLDDLVVGDLQAVAVLRADLVVAETVGGGVGGAGAGDGDRRRCRRRRSATGGRDGVAPRRGRRRRVTCMCSSLRCGGEQVDGTVELPERVRCVTGRGVHLEEAVDRLRSVAVGDVAPVGGDVELVDRGAGRRWRRGCARSRRSASRCRGRGPRPASRPCRRRARCAAAPR